MLINCHLFHAGVLFQIGLNGPSCKNWVVCIKSASLIPRPVLSTNFSANSDLC